MAIETLKEKRTETQDMPKGLPQTTLSICPVCKKNIGAEVIEKEGKVVMVKDCPEHGHFEGVMSTDPKLFLRIERLHYDYERFIENPQVPDAVNCPSACGLCQLHKSVPVQRIIDLTNRCNLKCPICFADAGDEETPRYLYEPTLEQIWYMLNVGYNIEPHIMSAVQFSGGEPTLDKDTFLEACRMARRVGYKVIYAATNGLNFGHPEHGLKFCSDAHQAGLRGAYLQFDAVGKDADEVYLQIRGTELAETKRRVVENFRETSRRFKTDMWLTLVPTLLNGVNNQYLGGIFRFMVENADIMQGVAAQPMAFTGRYDPTRIEQECYTSGDLVRDLEEQTDGLLSRDDFVPLSFGNPLAYLFNLLFPKQEGGYPLFTNHPHCSTATYVLVNLKTKPRQAASVMRLFDDFEELIREIHLLNQELATAPQDSLRTAKGTAKGLSLVRKHFKKRNPLGIGYGTALQALLGIMGRGRERYRKKLPVQLLLFGAMPFQYDLIYEIPRVERCIITYVAPNGRIYPFCAFNSGPCFRKQIEEEFGRPL